MSFTLGWYKRDEEGRRVKVDFALVREKMTWRLKPARFDQWQTFQPESEDWEALFDAIARYEARGRVDPTDVRLVKRLHREATSG